MPALNTSSLTLYDIPGLDEKYYPEAAIMIFLTAFPTAEFAGSSAGILVRKNIGSNQGERSHVFTRS